MATWRTPSVTGVHKVESGLTVEGAKVPAEATARSNLPTLSSKLPGTHLHRHNQLTMTMVMLAHQSQTNSAMDLVTAVGLGHTALPIKIPMQLAGVNLAI